jgi:hypothetical protein
MKRLLLLLALCLIIMPSLALVDTMQDPGSYATDNSSRFTCWGLSSTNCFWIQSSTGGNSYLETRDGDVPLLNSYPNPSAYWAASMVMPYSPGYGYDYIILYSNSRTSMWQYLYSGDSAGGTHRWELVTTSGVPYLYRDGIKLANGTSALAQNPSYVGLLSHNYPFGDFRPRLDDVIMSDTESKYIVGMPALNGYYIKKDMISPGASGFYNATTGALINSNTFDSTWGRSTLLTNNSELMYLVNAQTGTIYANASTGTGGAGTTSWDVATNLIAAGAPYGRYQVKFGDFYSTQIAYIASGASIAFDQNTYSQGDTAAVTYLIDAAYWNPSAYTYAIKIYNGNDWSVAHTQSISSVSGTASYTFTSSDTQGEYYAVLESTSVAGGNPIWMNYDYAALNAYFKMYGYVNGAENNTILAGANVSIVQGSTVVNQITPADGSYNATGFLTGTNLTVNATKSGYFQYLVSYVPMSSGAKIVNITLNATSPTYTGIGIGGVVRTGTLTGTVITGGYGKPIGGATCFAKNTTNGEYCTNVTNMAAWYKFDETNGCILTSKRPYDLWCQKAGYTGGNYTVVAA